MSYGHGHYGVRVHMIRNVSSTRSSLIITVCDLKRGQYCTQTSPGKYIYIYGSIEKQVQTTQCNYVN